MAFSLEYNSLEIDNKDGIVIKSLDGLETLPIRTSLDDKVGSHGGSIWEQLYGMRTITLTGTVSGDDADGYFSNKASLRGAFRLGDIADLTIQVWDSEETTREIPAKVVSALDIRESGGEPTFGRWQAQLLCPMPFFLDTTDTTATVGLVSGGFPVESPLETPIPFEGDGVVVENTGEVPTNPIYTFSGDIVNPTLYNETTGTQFTVKTTITGTDTVIVQLVNGVVDVKKGTENLVSGFRGEFVPLIVGNNTLRLFCSSYDDTPEAEVKFRNRYLGI